MFRPLILMQDQQEMNKVLSDAQMLQMQNQQHICSLLQSRLERVSPLNTPL